MGKRTLERRIMAAADRHASLWFNVARRVPKAADSARAARAILATLVAEAATTPPERVCRWLVTGAHGKTGCGSDVHMAEEWGEFCQGCGGRVETVEDGE